MTSPALSVPVRLTEVGRGIASSHSSIAHHVHDGPTPVAQRCRALVDELRRQILWMDQTHSAGVGMLAEHGGRARLDIDSESSFFDPQEPGTLVEANGAIVDRRDQPDMPAAVVMTADYMSVLLSSVDGRIVTVVHAGRGELLDLTLTQAFRLMRALDPPAPIQVFTVPSICGRCYEAPIDIQIECVRSRPELESTGSWEAPTLDLPDAVKAELLNVDCRGVTTGPRCTFEDDTLHFYRRDLSCRRNATTISPRQVLNPNSDTLTDALSRVEHHYWKTRIPGGGGVRLVHESQSMRPGHGLPVRWSSHTVVSSVRADRRRTRSAKPVRERSQHGEVII